MDIKFKNNKNRVPTNLVIKVKIGDLNKNLCVSTSYSYLFLKGQQTSFLL